MSTSTERTRETRPVFSGTLRLTPRAAPATPPPPPAPAAPTGRIGRRVADLATCRQKFPAVFDADRPLPLAIGIDRDLAAILGVKRARFLLAWWTGNAAYVAAVARGGARFRLDGTEDGLVSEEHRALASLDRAARVARKYGSRPAGDVASPSSSETLMA
jgi:sRNA-binding protein